MYSPFLNFTSNKPEDKDRFGIKGENGLYSQVMFLSNPLIAFLGL